MYIPQTNHLRPDSSPASAARLGVDLIPAHELNIYHSSSFPVESISCWARRVFGRSLGALPALNHTPSLRKRAADNVNTTIGVVVGILLAVFLVGAFAFLYVYRRSIRFKKRRHRRRKSSGSKGSKNSDGAGGAAAGDAPAAA
ncbi:hypothetical protein F4677DRAFT_235158 [Hypoxylon crocopeplum]|nr:hypothetical protein F4677DRAFT_235158 [Hypoxylon crocopeplum]